MSLARNRQSGGFAERRLVRRLFNLENFSRHRIDMDLDFLVGRHLALPLNDAVTIVDFIRAHF